MYHVFQTHPGKIDPVSPVMSENFKVVDTTGCNDNQAIEIQLMLHGWRGQDYYCSMQQTAEKAKVEVVKKFFYHLL